MDAVLIGKLVATGGFAAWLAINVLNHIQDFRGTLFAVAAFMKMSSLDEEPRIPTPLKWRRVESDSLHRVALVLIILAQASLALLFAWAFLCLLSADADDGERLAAYAFSGFALLWFGFLVSGAWFAYFIKQGDLQRTHMILLGLSLVGLILVRS